MKPTMALGLLLLTLGGPATRADTAEADRLPNGEVSARSFVDTSQIVSKYTTELYAHQSSMRIVKGIGYVAYQCNEATTDENAAGQKARLAIFNLLNPTATASWVDISQPGDSSHDITLAGKSVMAPMLHTVGENTLRIFFVGRQADDSDPAFRVLYKDYSLATGTLSELRQVRCTIGKTPGDVVDLTLPNVQAHLDHLFGPGTGAQFSRGISTACDMVPFDGHLYSAIQIKNSSDGKTLLLTNVLMRSDDDGATWQLLGAPDPRRLPGTLPADVKILAEPVITQNARHIFLHLRSNVQANGYVLTKTSKDDLYVFDTPVTKWAYGIGRPAIGDYGKPIGMVAMFTAASVPMGGISMTRNRCDVVQIDRTYSTYTRAFSIVDYNAVNTPFMFKYNDEMYVCYSTGRRRLSPPFGTSEIVFAKLRREYFVPTP
jgi:hypothetical protein